MLAGLGVHGLLGIVAAAVQSAQLGLLVGVQCVDLVATVCLNVFGSCYRMMRVRLQFVVCSALVAFTIVLVIFLQGAPSMIYVDRYFLVDVGYDVCLVLLVLQPTDGLRLLRDAWHSIFGHNFYSGAATGSAAMAATWEERTPLTAYPE